MSLQPGPSSALPTVSVAEAHARDGEVLLLDVREPAEWADGHAPGAHHVPLGQLGTTELPAARSVYVICRSGNRSGQATAALRAAGVEAANVEGGMIAWAAQGLPVTVDPPAPEEPSMPTVDLTAATFEDTISAEGIVLVDWWASWCGPCRMFAPIFEAAAGTHTDITFAKVDTEAEQQLAGAAGIMSIPTLMAFRDGILVFSQAGALPAATLEDLISQVRALDMDAVRAELAASAP